MSDQKNDKAAVNGATITIQQHPEGLAIGLEFHGENLDESDRAGMRDLALAGVEAMRDWVRERYSVKSEEVLRRKDYEKTKPTSH